MTLKNFVPLIKLSIFFVWLFFSDQKYRSQVKDKFRKSGSNISDKMTLTNFVLLMKLSNVGQEIFYPW